MLSLFLDLLFPDYCRVCGSLLIGSHCYVACNRCWREEFVPFYGKRCLICGHPIKLLPGTDRFCGRCLEESRSFYFDGVAYFSLNQGLVETAIKALKFERIRPVAGCIGRWMSARLLEFIHQVSPDLVVPIPLSGERLRERGYNQCEEILKGAGISFVRALDRIYGGHRQAELPFGERENNIKGVFEVVEDVKRKTILLFDDIFTTGSTVNEAARILKNEGAVKVFVFTVAYTVLLRGEANI